MRLCFQKCKRVMLIILLTRNQNVLLILKLPPVHPQGRAYCLTWDFPLANWTLRRTSWAQGSLGGWHLANALPTANGMSWVTLWCKTCADLGLIELLWYCAKKFHWRSHLICQMCICGFVCVFEPEEPCGRWELTLSSFPLNTGSLWQTVSHSA